MFIKYIYTHYYYHCKDQYLLYIYIYIYIIILSNRKLFISKFYFNFVAFFRLKINNKVIEVVLIANKIDYFELHDLMLLNYMYLSRYVYISIYIAEFILCLRNVS